VSFFGLLFRILVWRPRTALAALYWRLTGRRLRAHYRLYHAAAEAPFAYDVWIEHVERERDALERAPAVIAGWAQRSRFSIILSLGGGASAALVSDCIRSVLDQCYPDWELLIAPQAGWSPPALPADTRICVLPHRDSAALALTAAIDEAQGDWIIPLTAGTDLSPTALYRYAASLADRPDAIAAYGDQDWIDADGRRNQPWFKPEWDGEMFLAQDYASRACTVRADAARDARARIPIDAGEAAPYALLIEASAGAKDRIVHVPHIIAHVRARPWDAPSAERLEVVRRHVAPAGASVAPGPMGMVHVTWPLPPDPPLVSIIVPTRDKADLLGPCIDSVLRLTDYPAYEILVVDNGSREPETFALFARLQQRPNVRILPYPDEYNYSAINNFAAASAQGSYLCLLNNDTEVVEAAWLTEMMRQAVRPGTGAVGAKLLYADGSIQHAGVVIGMGNAAGHAHRFLAPGDAGYFGQTDVARQATAVTAACLVVEKRKYQAVGGLDEVAFRIAYNDVDLCMKLRREGWRNIYAPRAILYHHESKSRGADLSPAHIERYLGELAALQQRWATDRVTDPTHHPNLDRARETYALRLENGK